MSLCVTGAGHSDTVAGVAFSAHAHCSNADRAGAVFGELGRRFEGSKVSRNCLEDTMVIPRGELVQRSLEQILPKTSKR